MVLALLVGFTIGHLLHLEQWTSRFFHRLVKAMHLGGDNIDMEFYITAVALFCCSGFGWYSTLTEGIAGDPNLLFCKVRARLLHCDHLRVYARQGHLRHPAAAVRDSAVRVRRRTAAGRRADAGPCSRILSACGGVLTMSAGFRVSKIKSVPLVDLMPALLLVMPFSLLWTMLMG